MTRIICLVRGHRWAGYGNGITRVGRYCMRCHRRESNTAGASHSPRDKLAATADRDQRAIQFQALGMAREDAQRAVREVDSLDDKNPSTEDPA